VLDEPTEGLDPNQIAQIRDLIRSLAGQHTIILSSHILSEVQNTCDRIIIIHNGTIVQQGSYEELVTAMTSGRSYRLRVAREGARLATALKELSGVVSPRVAKAETGDHLADIEFGVATGAAEDVIDQVARRAVEGGHGLRELALRTKSLEEVFFQLTK
jgi:ABC-2 type transport system ATP-binding protein